MRRAQLEKLEVRRLLSGTPPFATLNGEILTVTGTPSADTIAAIRSGPSIIVSLNGMSDSFPVAQIQEMIFRGGNGRDSIGVSSGVTIRSLLVGGGGGDTLSAGGGSESLRGGNGLDSLIGASNGDSLSGDAGNNTIVAGATSLIAGALSIQGTPEADTISLSEISGAIVVDVDGSSDSLTTSEISSISIGGAAGRDLISVDAAISLPARLVGGAGGDTLIAGSGPTTLIGGDGYDSLVAGDFGDSLVGSAGHNTLFGGVANDTLHALNGMSDKVIGGGGTDIAHVDMSLDTVAGVADVLYS